MKKLLFMISIFFLLLIGCNADQNVEGNISDEAITNTITEMEEFDQVESANVIINENGINLLIEVPTDIEERQAQVIGKEMARILSNKATETNEEEELGEIYNDYNLSISLTHPNDTVVTQGTKATVIDTIQWDS